MSGLATWHFRLLSLMKVIHLETLLSQLSNEPLSNELVICNVTTSVGLELVLCFENCWRLK
jgi:hypothetical protein